MSAVRLMMQTAFPAYLVELERMTSLMRAARADSDRTERRRILQLAREAVARARAELELLDARRPLAPAVARANYDTLDDVERAIGELEDATDHRPRRLAA